MLLNDHSTMLSFCFTADDRSLTCLFLYLHFAKLLCQLRATARALTPAFGDSTGYMYPDNSETTDSKNY